MPLAAGLGGARPPAKPPATTPATASSKHNLKQLRQQAPATALAAIHNKDDDDQETTTDDSSDEEAALEMDGQELWTQTYCVTCDCLIEPGEGIAKPSTSNPTSSSSPLTHSTLKSRSGTIKARGSNASDTHPSHPHQPKAASATKSAAPPPLKRTHSAGRLHAKAGGGPLGPHKRTGSAGSRLNALSELRPTTKLHDDKPKSKSKSNSNSKPSGPNGHKSPAVSRPGSAASNRSQSNSSGPSSFKSNEALALAAANAHTSSDAPARNKKRGLLGGLGLTPAALKQEQDELAVKRKAPTPLYCSERCRLIDERRSTGLAELTQYMSQPLLPPAHSAWAPPLSPPQTWTRTASVSSIPPVNNTPDSECLCPECIDKYPDGCSAANVPSGASDTATESSVGFIYARGTVQKPRTASGRLITPLGLHPPGVTTEGYFPQYAPAYTMTPAAQNSPRVQPADTATYTDAAHISSIPARSSSAASAGNASTAGTEGSAISSESGSSLWEPRLKPQSIAGAPNATGSHTSMRNGFPAASRDSGIASGLSTNTATPAITPRQSMIVPSSSASHNVVRAARRLSVPSFAPTHEVDEEAQHASDLNRTASPAYTLPHRPASSRSKPSSLLLATSPLNLLDRASQHHAPPSVDLFSEHVGSPTARASLLSRSLASEHTLMGTSGITLMNQPTLASSHHTAQPQLQPSQDGLSTRRSSALSQSLSSHRTTEPSHWDAAMQRTDTDDSLSLAVGSLRLAQSRASAPLASAPRRNTDASESRPADMRRLSLFGVAGASQRRRNSNTASISSSNSGSNASGWLRSLSSAWLNWRTTTSPAPLQTDSDVLHSTDDSDEWPSRNSSSMPWRESNASHNSSTSARPSYAQNRASSLRNVSMEQSNMLYPTDISHQSTDDRKSAITPTQSLVAKPTIRRGRVPAYVSEIGQGGIPGDSSPAETKTEDGAAAAAAADPAQRLARARVDSFTRLTDADAAQKKASRRRSRDISVLPPLLAPISRSGSSTNLYGQVPRSGRAYSTGRAWTAGNTPQMYVGSAGSSHQQAILNGQPPHSPTLMRSPYHSSLALTQDAARAALSSSRPNSAAGYHSLPYSAGTSPRAKGLGWGAMTSIASPPSSSDMSAAAHAHQGGHRQSMSYGHAAAIATRQCINPGQKGQQHHHHHHHHHSGHQHQHQYAHQHQHQNPHSHHHHHGRHSHGHNHRGGSSGSDVQIAAGQADEQVTLGHVMSLGTMPTSAGQPVYGRHSTMPVTLHRSPTPSVPEDGGEMTSQDLTSGDFVSRPTSAMGAPNSRRHHRTSLMPPPRSRSSLGMHASRGGVQPLTSTDAGLVRASEDGTLASQHAEQHEPARPHEPARTWSYDQLSGLKTYPILQLPDRETHDVYDPAWGLDAGGLAKHLGQDRTNVSTNDVNTDGDGKRLQMGFQPHRKKLFYFDA